MVHPQAWFTAKLFSPFGIRTEKTHFGDVSGVTFTPKKNVRPNTIFVFLHGGGYCIGSSLSTHRIGLANLTKTTSCVCHSVDYRLAPKHPYPAALDDAMQAWQAIVADNPDSQIILSGDSAGGGLSPALMMRLRDEGGRLPDAAVLFSPWTDLTCSSQTYKTLAKVDPWSPTSLRMIVLAITFLILLTGRIHTYPPSSVISQAFHAHSFLSEIAKFSSMIVERWVKWPKPPVSRSKSISGQGCFTIGGCLDHLFPNPNNAFARLLNGFSPVQASPSGPMVTARAAPWIAPPASHR